LRETLKDETNNFVLNILKYSAISGNYMKRCCCCKEEKSSSLFGKLSSSKDGLRYDCSDCRKEYKISIKEHVKQKNKSYYFDNKENLIKKIKYIVN